MKLHSLTAKEYAELSGVSRAESETQLNELAANELLQKINSKNGAIWKLRKNSN